LRSNFSSSLEPDPRQLASNETGQYLMNERNQIIIKLLLVQIILPLGLTIAFFVISNDAHLFFLITQTYLCILFLSGYWEFFSGLFKKLFFLSLEAILFIILFYKLATSSHSHFNIVLLFIFSFIQAYLFFALVKIIMVVSKKEKNSLEITFPLSNGKYLVTDGGNSKMSRLMNYHFYSPVHRKNKTNKSMQFAIDIVKIDSNKTTFLPTRNNEYPIFGEKVSCPLEGKVIQVENNIDDNEPFIGTYPYNTGNTLVIKIANYYLLLGHLKKGSITVSKGEIVKAGDFIGQIGNSGYSERPHLHMQLIESDSDNFWFGKGIPMTFKGKNLFKNRVIKIV
jgi:hypothetical protein